MPSTPKRAQGFKQVEQWLGRTHLVRTECPPTRSWRARNPGNDRERVIDYLGVAHPEWIDEVAKRPGTRSARRAASTATSQASGLPPFGRCAPLIAAMNPGCYTSSMSQGQTSRFSQICRCCVSDGVPRDTLPTDLQLPVGEVVDVRHSGRRWLRSRRHFCFAQGCHFSFARTRLCPIGNYDH